MTVAQVVLGFALEQIRIRHVEIMTLTIALNGALQQAVQVEKYVKTGSVLLPAQISATLMRQIQS